MDATARNTTTGEAGVNQPSLGSRAESGFESMGQPSDHTGISPAGATGQSGNTMGSYSDEVEEMELDGGQVKEPRPTSGEPGSVAGDLAYHECKVTLGRFKKGGQLILQRATEIIDTIDNIFNSQQDKSNVDLTKIFENLNEIIQKGIELKEIGPDLQDKFPFCKISDSEPGGPRAAAQNTSRNTVNHKAMPPQANQTDLDPKDVQNTTSKESISFSTSRLAFHTCTLAETKPPQAKTAEPLLSEFLSSVTPYTDATLISQPEDSQDRQLTNKFMQHGNLIEAAYSTTQCPAATVSCTSTIPSTAPVSQSRGSTVSQIPSQLYKEFLYNHGEISPHAVQNCLYNGSPSAAATQAVCPQQHSIITTEACQQNSSSSTEGPLQNSTEGPQQNSTEVSLQNSSVRTEGSLQNSSASTKGPLQNSTEGPQQNITALSTEVSLQNSSVRTEGSLQNSSASTEGPLQNSTEGPQQNITALSTEVSLHNSSVSTEGSVQNSSASTEGPQQNSSASTQGSLQNSSTGPQHNSRASTASTNAAPLQDTMVVRARNTTTGETGVTQPSLESRAESGFESMGQPSDHTRISPAGATGQSGNTMGSYSDEDEAMELIPPHPPHAVQNSPFNDSPSAAATQADNGHPPHQSSFNQFLDNMSHHPLQNSAAVSPLRTLPLWDIRKTRYCKSTEFMVADKLYSFSRSVGGIVKNNHLWGTCSRHGQRHVMTNWHVASPRFADLSNPSNSFVEFNYYDKWPPQQPIRLKIQSIEYSCPKSSLDFCVLLLDIPDSSFEEFQRLSPGLGPQVMLPGAEVEVERVTLIGHPLGHRKSFDYNCPVLDWYQSDEYVGGISSSDDSAIFHADRINYRSTFWGGGSGSSVVAIFDDRPQIVAMHTQGYPTGKTCEVEQGVRMSAIQAHLKEHRPHLYRELFP